MREIRPSGSEGGAGRKPRSYLYRSPATRGHFMPARIWSVRAWTSFSVSGSRRVVEAGAATGLRVAFCQQLRPPAHVK